MKLRSRSSRAAAAGIVAACAIALGLPAGAQTSNDVSLAVVTGSRTLTVSTAAGGSLSGGNLDLGASRRGAFAVNVLDVDYDHVGYQVSATLSNLYLLSGSGFDCAKRVDSQDLGVNFPADPTVADLGALVSGVVDLTGTVTADVVAAIDPTGTVGTALSLVGVSLEGQAMTVEDLVNQTTGSANELLDGLDSRLPVRISAGSAGGFTSAAAHPTCGEAAGTPTDRILMSGDASSAGDLVASIVSGLQTAVNGVTGSTLVSNDVVPAADAQAGTVAAIQALHAQLEAATGLELPPFATDGTAVQAVLDALTGVLQLTDVIGQTGTYLIVPELRGDGVTAPQTGVYRGTMTVTLVDTP